MYNKRVSEIKAWELNDYNIFEDLTNAKTVSIQKVNLSQMVSDKDKPRIGLMSPTHTMDSKPNESHSY